MYRKTTVVVILLWLTLISNPLYGDVIELKIPIVSDSPKQHMFYHELLTTALIQAGHSPKLSLVSMPQSRIKRYLELGELSIYWMIETPERNKQFTQIPVGLTNDLIGNRVLFIRKGEQALYDNIYTLSDFRALALSAGFGKGWFDAKVWRENKLKYREHDGNWSSIFKMVINQHAYDYFSRGLNEILIEAQKYPELDIEKNLLFIYQRDFQFYLSNVGNFAGNQYQTIITDAMEQAKNNGLIKQMVRKYWASDFNTLNYDNRIKIFLTTPVEN
jgi:hypothetical protein